MLALSYASKWLVMAWRIPRADFYPLYMEFIFLRDNHNKTLEEKELMSEKTYALVSCMPYYALGKIFSMQ